EPVPFIKIAISCVTKPPQRLDARAAVAQTNTPRYPEKSKAEDMSKDDLVVVTGAGGFIGGHLVKVLQQRGHSRLRAVDVKPLAEWYQKHPGVETQVGDLALL